MFIQKLKKTHLRLLLLIIAFAVLFFILLFYLIQKQVHNTIQQQEANKRILAIEAQKKAKIPVRLIIPAINVNTGIQYLGVTQTGEMEVPTNATDVGWFKLGPRPGEKGSSVIAGHFDNENGGAGVFTNLYKLKKGDKLFVKDNKGKVITFIVRESRTYDPGYTDDVFNSSDVAHLNLVTCDGVWDGVKKSYSKRLVVFSDKL